jgi:uncharacterized protein (DUF433 family)
MDTAQQTLLERITIIPGLLNGKPTIRGLRFPVSDILELLSLGMSTNDINDIHAALHYASLKMKNTTVIHAA